MCVKQIAEDNLCCYCFPELQKENMNSSTIYNCSGKLFFSSMYGASSSLINGEREVKHSEMGMVDKTLNRLITLKGHQTRYYHEQFDTGKILKSEFIECNHMCCWQTQINLPL